MAAQHTGFEASLFLLLLETQPLLLLLALAAFFAFLEHGRTPLRLLFLHPAEGDLLALGVLLTAAGSDCLLQLVEVCDHARQALLGLEILKMSLAVCFNARLLRLFEHFAIVRLLHLVVFGEQRTFFLAVGTFDVVDALGKHPHALVETLFLLLELLHLKLHEIIRVEVLDVLDRRSAETLRQGSR